MAFIPQTFEDLTVEKEVAVRRRMAKEYVDVSALCCVLLTTCRFNKKRDDFDDLRQYNDYLEMVEDIGPLFDPSLPTHSLTNIGSIQPHQ